MRRELYQARRQIADENKGYPAQLRLLSYSEWAPKIAMHIANGFAPPFEAWRSRSFLVQLFSAPAPALERMTVNRSTPEKTGWAEEISWETLQRLKSECGRGNLTAVEIFPADKDIVNVANMRHLWILPEPPAFAWQATTVKP